MDLNVDEIAADVGYREGPRQEAAFKGHGPPWHYILLRHREYSGKLEGYGTKELDSD